MPDKDPVASRAEQGPTGRLTMNDIQALLREADLSENDFDEEWQLDALVYKTLLWVFANDFSRKGGFSTEMTHAEFGKDEETNKTMLDLCLAFLGDEGTINKYDEFATYLENRIELLPPELRKKFDVLIGFNYGNLGGFRIREDAFESVSQSVLDAFQSEGPIGHLHDFNKAFDFQDKVTQRLRVLGKQ